MKKQLKRRANNGRCPECGHSRAVKNGRQSIHDGGGQRLLCRGCGHRFSSARAVHTEDGTHNPAITKRRLVITSAQNATPVYAPFFAALEHYCKANGAQLLVIPYRYHNPTSIWSEKAKDSDWWDKAVAPYLIDVRKSLNANLVLLGDIKTQPTATRPLAGFETLTGPLSAIIGHPKLELTSVPTPQSRLPKILTTTGSCTKPNYVPSKAGKKSEFHHTYGACVVELDDKLFHIRQINAARNGSFMELSGPHPHATLYTRDGVKPGSVTGVVLGDSHLEFADPQVFEATFALKTGLIDQLRPDFTVWHDVHDFYSRNHHHINEPFIDYVKHVAGTDDVEKMLDATFAIIDVIAGCRPWMHNIFVPSNHPDALAKWVKRADWRYDPRNAKFLLRTILAMLEGSKWGEAGAQTIDPFAYWGMKKLISKNRVTFLKRDQGFMIKDIDVGQHGDVGPNGARGNRRSFTRIGVKSIIGHSHSPGIEDGVYQTGTNSRLTLEFVKGPSSWLHTDCIIYGNGKRTLINIIDGRWRA